MIDKKSMPWCPKLIFSGIVPHSLQKTIMQSRYFTFAPPLGFSNFPRRSLQLCWIRCKQYTLLKWSTRQSPRHNSRTPKNINNRHWHLFPFDVVLIYATLDTHFRKSLFISGKESCLTNRYLFPHNKALNLSSWKVWRVAKSRWYKFRLRSYSKIQSVVKDGARIPIIPQDGSIQKRIVIDSITLRHRWKIETKD